MFANKDVSTWIEAQYGIGLLFDLVTTGDK